MIELLASSQARSRYPSKGSDESKFYCFRSIACSPLPVLTFAKVPGGYDPVPVTVRAKPHGSVAEDLIEDHLDFLRVLVDFVS